MPREEGFDCFHRLKSRDSFFSRRGRGKKTIPVADLLHSARSNGLNRPRPALTLIENVRRSNNIGVGHGQPHFKQPKSTCVVCVRCTRVPAIRTALWPVYRGSTKASLSPLGFHQNPKDKLSRRAYVNVTEGGETRARPDRLPNGVFQ